MENIQVLSNSALFKGIEPDEIKAMLSCLSAKKKIFKKGEFIFYNGDVTESIGFVLSGRVHILKEDFWGNTTLMDEAGKGRIFGEAYACAENAVIESMVKAMEDTEILFLNMKRVTSICTNACGFHARLINNLLNVIAQKNIMLSRKMEFISKKSLREKILSYLSAESIKNNSNNFIIPFNRQQLADYLAADRSALSNELSKLQKEGIISFKKNSFILNSDSDIL